MKVAVIGSGISGIATLRQLSGRPEISHVVAYEQNTELGGTWVYTDRVGEDERGVPILNSTYRDLKTNDTLELVRFPDLEYPDEHPPGSFRSRQEVLHYLNYYVDHFNLRKYIQLETEVTRVEPITAEDGRLQWRVDVRRHAEPQRPLVTDIFDAVFVCNGIFSVPVKSDIPGLDSFRGHLMHSHDFRKPEMFEGQRVMCVGAGPSGIDLSMIIAPLAKQVYLSYRGPFVTQSSIFPDGIKLVPCIKEVRERSVVLEDGQELELDAIVLCTGYRLCFPFLADVCRPKDDAGRCTPLYKHVIHAEYPTLFFIGMLKHVPTFHVSPFVTQFALATLLKHAPLPDKDTMLKEIEEEFHMKLSLGLPPHCEHMMFPINQFFQPYHDSLLAMVKTGNVLQPVPTVVSAHLEHTGLVLFTDPKHFRSNNYPLDTDWSKHPTQDRYPLRLGGKQE